MNSYFNTIRYFGFCTILLSIVSVVVLIPKTYCADAPNPVRDKDTRRYVFGSLLNELGKIRSGKVNVRHEDTVRSVEYVLLFAGHKYNVSGKVVYREGLDPLVRANSDTRNYDFCFTTDSKRIGFWGSHTSALNVYSQDAFPYWHYIPCVDPRLLGIVPPIDAMGPELLNYERYYGRLERVLAAVAEFSKQETGNWTAKRVLDGGGTVGVITNEFDPAKGLLPVSLKATVEQRAQKRTELHYHHIIGWGNEGGLWLPKTAHQPQPGTFSPQFTTTYDWHEVNQPVDDGVFAYTAIKNPAITQVIDHSVPGEPPTVIARPNSGGPVSAPAPVVARSSPVLWRVVVAVLVVLPGVYYLVRYLRRRA